MSPEKPYIHVRIARAIDAALQRMYPETAEHGYAEARANKGLLELCALRGVRIPTDQQLPSRSTRRVTGGRSRRAPRVRHARTALRRRRRR